MSRPSLPSLPRRPAVPGGQQPARTALPQLPETDDTDQFGLSRQVFGTLPEMSRRYLARAYEEYHADKSQPPQHLGLGTTPEVVTQGGLLVMGFTIGNTGPRSFVPQHAALGGRALGGGGAVVDVAVFHDGRRIAVDVDSIFHAPDNPFSGGAKIEQDVRQRYRVLSSGLFDSFISVNRPEDGRPLEMGPDALVVRDIQRIVEA